MRATRTALWSALVVLGLSVVLAAPHSGAATGQVAIVKRQFTPAEITVEVGQKVTWTNKDTNHVHSVTADDGSFDSSPNCSAGNPGACLDDRDTFEYTFAAEGRFPYYSRPHGGPGGQGTSGVVVVVPVGTPKAKPCPTTSSTSSSSTTTTTMGSTTSTTVC